VSRPPYDTANLGFATDDDRDRVRENRRRVGASLGGLAADPRAWVGAHQVHGATVVRVDGASPGSGTPADALVTTQADVALLVLTADCVPLALVAPGAVAAVHAGWRGLLAGVVESAVKAVRATGEVRVRGVIGPCISAARYEFGGDDIDRVAARLGATVRARTSGGAPALDLRAAVRGALGRAGVHDVTDVDVCTASSPDYFSYRRDRVTGRQALLVTRTP
jgi:polyphenol oxidase